MNSGLYACRVMHERFAPRRHRFAYGMFLLDLDLDELDAVGRRCRLLSVNGRNVYAFREGDYLPTGASGPLKRRVTAYAAEHGVDLAGGRVRLLTLPRMFGYAFNPVSFYFCTDRDGRPAAAIAEVTNTFRETKLYFFGPAEWSGGAFRARRPKYFYVSPYSDVDVNFDFALPVPDGRMGLRIDDYTGDRRTLTSALTGERRELSDLALLAALLRYPLLTVRVIALIHWHALRLWLKKVPWYAKAARAADQRGVLHPHRSLVPPCKAP